MMDSGYRMLGSGDLLLSSWSCSVVLWIRPGRFGERSSRCHQETSGCL